MRRLGGLAVAVSWLALAASPTLAAEAGAEGGGGLWYKGLIALAAGLGLGLAARAALGTLRPARLVFPDRHHDLELPVAFPAPVLVGRHAGGISGSPSGTQLLGGGVCGGACLKRKRARREAERAGSRSPARSSASRVPYSRRCRWPSCSRTPISPASTSRPTSRPSPPIRSRRAGCSSRSSSAGWRAATSFSQASGASGPRSSQASTSCRRSSARTKIRSKSP